MTSDQIATRLRALSRAMLSVGCDMDYYGGMGEMGIHGRELVGAARVVDTWADGMESVGCAERSEAHRSRAASTDAVRSSPHPTGEI